MAVINDLAVADRRRTRRIGQRSVLFNTAVGSAKADALASAINEAKITFSLLFLNNFIGYLF